MKLEDFVELANAELKMFNVVVFLFMIGLQAGGSLSLSGPQFRVS